MIHERKFQDHHEILFETLRRYCKSNLTNVPIAIDMERGILNAIEAETTLKVVGCWRHLRKDIEREVFSLSGNKPDASFYVDEVYEILHSSTKASVQMEIDKRQNNWSAKFKEYFKAHVQIKLEYFARAYIEKNVCVHPENGVTSNQSEGFNWLMKDLNNWKEGPIDSVVLSFRFLQQYFLGEIMRGKAGVGNFTLRDEHRARQNLLTVARQNCSNTKSNCFARAECQSMDSFSDAQNVENGSIPDVKI